MGYEYLWHEKIKSQDNIQVIERRASCYANSTYVMWDLVDHGIFVDVFFLSPIVYLK